MASSNTADNICVNCSSRSSNGLIRQSMFFCCSDCYDAQTHVNFDKYKKNVRFDIKSSGSSHLHVHSHHGGNRMHLTPYKPIIKQCNYCFDRFDTNMHPGTPYGRMWFCSQHHLNLANPRPKHVIVSAPSGPIIMGGHGPFIMGGPRIIGPFMGPFFG